MESLIGARQLAASFACFGRELHIVKMLNQGSRLAYATGGLWQIRIRCSLWFGSVQIAISGTIFRMFIVFPCLLRYWRIENKLRKMFTYPFTLRGTEVLRFSQAADRDSLVRKGPLPPSALRSASVWFPFNVLVPPAHFRIATSSTIDQMAIIEMLFHYQDNQTTYFVLHSVSLTYKWYCLQTL